MAERPKTALIGDGNVGSALSQGLQTNGYETKSTGKDPEGVREVASWGEVIILAVPYPERENAIREMGDAVHGKVVVDVTNAIDSDGHFAGTLDRSGAEMVQNMAPEARVVKAFNTVFANTMSRGEVRGERLSILVAGDDGEAKGTVLNMARDIGFDAVDAGPLENARLLEPLGYLNIQLGYKQGLGPEMGIRLVHEGNEAAQGTQRPQAEKRRS